MLIITLYVYIYIIGGHIMNAESYLNNLEKKFEKHFIIEKNVQVFDKKLDMFAKYSEVNGRTLITQSDIIDRFEINEFCFIKIFERASIEDVCSFSEFLKQAAGEFVKPHREHRNSYITGIMISEDRVNKETSDFIKKFKYSKIYKFYLHGWCEARLILTDLSQNAVITNREAKVVEKVYQPAP